MCAWRDTTSIHSGNALQLARTISLQSILTPQTIRHTMASNASHAGVDPATSQAIGG
jgi:hypothetical protein